MCRPTGWSVKWHSVEAPRPRLLSKRVVQLLDALTLGGLAAAVVTGGGDDGGVAGELLRGREVHAGVEQIRHDYVA